MTYHPKEYVYQRPAILLEPCDALWAIGFGIPNRVTFYTGAVIVPYGVIQHGFLAKLRDERVYRVGIVFLLFSNYNRTWQFGETLP